MAGAGRRCPRGDVPRSPWPASGVVQDLGRLYAVTAVVATIQRADYEGDHTALKRLREELAPFVGTPELARASCTGAGLRYGVERSTASTSRPIAGSSKRT